MEVLRNYAVETNVNPQYVGTLARNVLSANAGASHAETFTELKDDLIHFDVELFEPNDDVVCIIHLLGYVVTFVLSVVYCKEGAMGFISLRDMSVR